MIERLYSLRFTEQELALILTGLGEIPFPSLEAFALEDRIRREVDGLPRE